MHDTTSLLYAMHARGITVYREGTIDLNGSVFYHFEDRIILEYYPEISEDQRSECTMTYAFRPSQPLFFYDCRDVTLRDVTISNVIIRDRRRGLCIMAGTDTGLVENVSVSNLQVETRVRTGKWWGNGEAICKVSPSAKKVCALEEPPDYWLCPKKSPTKGCLL